MQLIYTYFRCFALVVLLIAGLSRMAFADAVEETPCIGTPETPALDISVVNVRSAKGLVTLTIYPDDEKRFLAKGQKVSRLRVLAQTPVTHACMPVPKAGFYAIALYHDEDGDRKFDRTMLGLPDEGYGLSNDAPAIVGLPSFKSVRFEAVPGVTPMRITVRY